DDDESHHGESSGTGRRAAVAPGGEQSLRLQTQCLRERNEPWFRLSDEVGTTVARRRCCRADQFGGGGGSAPLSPPLPPNPPLPPLPPPKPPGPPLPPPKPKPPLRSLISLNCFIWSSVRIFPSFSSTSFCSASICFFWSSVSFNISAMFVGITWPGC